MNLLIDLDVQEHLHFARQFTSGCMHLIKSPPQVIRGWEFRVMFRINISCDWVILGAYIPTIWADMQP
jgi:hypothetical protein